MQLMLIQINIHDSYLLPIFHTSTEVKYDYTLNINNVFPHSIHLRISLYSAVDRFVYWAWLFGDSWPSLATLIFNFSV